ncbi:MAG TPA: CrcB family protein [Egicoccus sp.]|nr:CrcB family protein [Egicoccus sp.]HSK21724.1 CrcB family protein [Egicoccus sp.]
MNAAQVLWTVPLVAVGGAVGAVVRHLAVATGSARGPGARAAAIAVCNLAGAVALAAVVGLEGQGDWWLTAVVGAGFCGALTTFSTWVVDGAASLQTRSRPPTVVVVLDLFGQLAVGVGLAWLVLRIL